MRNYARAVAATVALLLILPVGAEAQSRPMYELPALQVTALQNPLHVEALALYELPDRWIEAARLHERAARQLPKKDAGQYFGFRQASLLYFYSNDLGSARRAMQRAADVAEATGDVLTAAQTWVDAAFIAVAEGYGGKHREFVANARELAASELLLEVERAAILERIDGSPSDARAARIALLESLPRLTVPVLAD